MIKGMTKYMPHPMTASYNASKAALSQYSNTLRLELEPVNVRVIELVTGRVSTKLISLPSLNDTSIYKPLEPALQSRAKEAGTKPPFFHTEMVHARLTSNTLEREDAKARRIC